MKRYVVFSFNFLPDQSPGAKRSKYLIDALLNEDVNIKLWLLTSTPRRYGQNLKKKNIKNDNYFDESLKSRVNILRFWIPYFGSSSIASALSYSFYAIQTIPIAIFLRPNVVIATSAKLLTTSVAAISAKISKAKLFIDIRDTFTDNYFYFYRWKKRIIFLSLIACLENLVIRSSNSINLISKGFEDAFKGTERLALKYSINFTNFSNGISKNLKLKIRQKTTAKKIKNKLFTVIYAGNIGEGQDLVGLIEDFRRRPDVILSMKNSNIIFKIYGAGPQLKKIKYVLKEMQKEIPFSLPIKYCNLIKTENMPEIYEKADCLMLQLAAYSSLSMVIPSKIYEYASTPYPIVYSAKGFTSDFISRIDSTIYFKETDSLSFYRAIQDSLKLKVNVEEREKFLNCYANEIIYRNYAKHIIKYIN